MPEPSKRKPDKSGKEPTQFQPWDLEGRLAEEYAENADQLLVYGAVDEDIDARTLMQESRESEEAFQDEFADDVLEDTMIGTATEGQTGGFTPGGVSEDLTVGALGGGRRMGGVTGGDVYGAGAGGGGRMSPESDTVKGVDKPFSADEDTGLEARIAAENAEVELREDIRHGKTRQE